MSGGGQQSPPQGPLADLIQASRRHIGRAIDAWAALRHDDAILSAAMGVEILAKAALYSLNPALIVPMSASGEKSLIRICSSSRSIWDLETKTVGARDAINRLAALNSVQFSRPVSQELEKQLFDARNSVAHVGRSFSSSTGELATALALVAEIFPIVNEDKSTFFGRYETQADDLISGALDILALAIRARMLAAESRFRETRQPLGSQNLLALVENGLAAYRDGNAPLPDSYHGVREKCPVCAYDGILFGVLDAEPVVDYDECRDEDGIRSTSPFISGYEFELKPENFRCFVCDLTLAGRGELSHAGLHVQTMRCDDEDLIPEFQSAWRDFEEPA